MYKYEVKEKLANKLKKLAKKDRFYYELLVKKILQIAENPYTGKPLRNVLRAYPKSPALLKVIQADAKCNIAV